MSAASATSVVDTMNRAYDAALSNDTSAAFDGEIHGVTFTLDVEDPRCLVLTIHGRNPPGIVAEAGFSRSNSRVNFRKRVSRACKREAILR